MEPSGGRLRLSITTEDKEERDVVVYEDDTIWGLKIRVFEQLSIFPGKQALSVKDPDEPVIVLNNDKLVKDYNLKSGCSLFLTPQAKELKSVVSPPTTTKRSGSSARAGGFLGLLSMKKVPSPRLCFALGRGLKRSVVGCPCSFQIFKVDHRGKQLKSEDDFDIDITHRDNSKAPYRYERSNGNHSIVVFTPIKNGEYRISIRSEGAEICNSPYRGVAIDETTHKIKELVFANDWLPETTQLYAVLSQRAETVDNIFLVGHEGLLHLMRNGSRQVQSDMTTVFACLLKKDENKYRLVREMGYNILKVLKTDHWSVHLEIKCFIARFLVLLSATEENCVRILDEVGTIPLAGLARTPNPECSRGCARVLAQMSSYASTRLRLVKDNVFSIMYILMHQDDIITTYDTFCAIANLCHIDDAQMHILRENMVPFIVSRVNSENIRLRVQALQILAALSEKPEFTERLYASGLHTTVVQHAEGLMAGLLFQWEVQSARLLYSKDEKGDMLVTQLTRQFEEDIGCGRYTATILANMLNFYREEMSTYITKGTAACLRMLRRMCRSADIITQIESCRVLEMLSSPDQPQEVKEALIAGGIVVALMQSMYMDKPVLLGYIISTLTNLSKFNRTCLESVSATEVDKLLEVMKTGGPSMERSACFLLGSMVAIDKFRHKIVTGGGQLFLTHLIDLVRCGELDLLPEIDQSELQVIKKIGRGVSGVVWKAEWKGHAVAVKSFNESNIAFNVDEFASEMALMSVLRHENIVHCLGGSRWAKKLFLVSEFFDRGSLYDVIHTQKTQFTIGRILDIAIAAASGLQYLHSLGLIHRDVKTGNLLISRDWGVKLGDFGVSRVVAKRMTRAVGTPCYMAPEVLEGQDYTLAADVYSYALLLWEMMARQTPFQSTAHLEIARSVVEEQARPPIPDQCPAPIADLIKKCWHPDPTSRPNFTEVLDSLYKIKASFGEAYCETMYIVDEPAPLDELPITSPKTTEPEYFEDEREWEQLCQQYKTKSKVKTKEKAKSKGASDLNIYKASRKEVLASIRAMNANKEANEGLTHRDSTLLFELPPRNPSILNTPDIPVISVLPRARSLSSISSMLAPDSPLEEAHPHVDTSPRPLDFSPHSPAAGRLSPRSPVRHSDNITERSASPLRQYPSTPVSNEVAGQPEDTRLLTLDESGPISQQDAQTNMPSTPEASSTQVSESSLATEGSTSSLLITQDLSSDTSSESSSSDTYSPLASPLPSPQPSPHASPDTLDMEQAPPHSPSQMAPKPPPRRLHSADHPYRAPASGSFLGRPPIMRHHQVASPQLYRSNTSNLHRPLHPAKSFSVAITKPDDLFMKVVLKPVPRKLSNPSLPSSASMEDPEILKQEEQGGEEPEKRTKSTLEGSGSKEGGGEGGITSSALLKDSKDLVSRSHDAAHRSTSLITRSNNLMTRTNEGVIKTGELMEAISQNAEVNPLSELHGIERKDSGPALSSSTDAGGTDATDISSNTLASSADSTYPRSTTSEFSASTDSFQSGSSLMSSRGSELTMSADSVSSATNDEPFKSFDAIRLAWLNNTSNSSASTGSISPSHNRISESALKRMSLGPHVPRSTGASPEASPPRSPTKSSSPKIFSKSSINLRNPAGGDGAGGSKVIEPRILRTVRSMENDPKAPPKESSPIPFPPLSPTSPPPVSSSPPSIGPIRSADAQGINSPSPLSLNSPAFTYPPPAYEPAASSDATSSITPAPAPPPVPVKFRPPVPPMRTKEKRLAVSIDTPASFPLHYFTQERDRREEEEKKKKRGDLLISPLAPAPPPVPVKFRPPVPPRRNKEKRLAVSIDTPASSPPSIISHKDPRARLSKMDRSESTPALSVSPLSPFLSSSAPQAPSPLDNSTPPADDGRPKVDAGRKIMMEELKAIFEKR